ncbi:ABC-F family ATP-binding cassette domain-containing protein [Candidatus Dojkabacteria bacterium]|uniref:ABC-F family ATP-binding cassette domain-containing protein n=1 Tax=Candidatus Dojkabacteria bacterium TaxID=2099670 RepID=A0A955L8L4_9BACT|nr:ABC-F family ATP-binding cassette domain-containing protein [Candidatus Dojkabacteria bacterium]
MLRVQNLSLEFSQKIFEDVSFSLGNKEKVGLVGLNGCGKSTLLKLITGEYKPDKGSISSTDETIEYLPQEMNSIDEFDTSGSSYVGEFLESLVDDIHTELWKVNKLVDKLEIGVDEFDLLSQISEGQKMKLLLVQLLLKEPTILLLDEPTNHLDIVGIEWFEKFITSFDGICIIISHDREFLNSTVTKIFEIDEHTLNVFDGNYDRYLIEKETWIEKRAQEFELQERKRKKLEERIELIRTFGSGKKQKAMLSNARKRLEREVYSNEVAKYKKQKLQEVSLEGEVHNSKMIVDIQNLTFGYPNKEVLLEDANFDMYGRERVWFFGRNGIGKTTLIRLLTKEFEPDQGECRLGMNLTYQYFSQDQSHLDMNMSVRDFVLYNTSVSFDRSFGMLEKFLFPKALQNNLIKDLSPGQRARLSFAVFSQHEYDFLILDEPTNHLDIQTKEVIEEAIREFKGAVLLISHDRYFVDSVGIDKIITLQDKKIREL